jgi:dolichol-phosphate mannosyltransferase
MMADESDGCRDLVRDWNAMNEGWDAVYAWRFKKGGGVIDSPWLKLRINRPANFLIRALFGIKPNDATNAFTAERTRVILGCYPILSYRFNSTVERPLNTIIRGDGRTVIPMTGRD